MISSIKIGEQVYQINYTKKPFDETADLGGCNPNKNIINILNTGDLNKDHQTLSHELQHALMAESGASPMLDSYDEKIEELFCLVMESTFYKFLKDNSNLFNNKDHQNYKGTLNVML